MFGQNFEKFWFSYRYFIYGNEQSSQFYLCSCIQIPHFSILHSTLAPNNDQHYTSTEQRLHLVEVEHTVQYSTMLTAKK